MNKYVYGVKIKDGTVTITVTEKENWIKNNQYSNFITDDLKDLFKSLGYYFIKRNCQFEKENENRSIEEIAQDLNKNSTLEYNEEFNDFSFKYVFSFFKSREAGNVFILCVTSKIYWLNNNCLSDNQPDDYITEFIDNIGLLEHAESTYSLPKENSKENKKIKDELENFQYLEFSKEFESFIKNIY